MTNKQDILEHGNETFDRNSKVMQLFLAQKYAFAILVDITHNECTSIFFDDNLLTPIPAKMTFNELFDYSRKVIHPLYLAQYDTLFSKDALIAGANAHNDVIQFEFLHFLKGDKNYHWFLLNATYIDDGTDDIVYVYTAQRIDDLIEYKQRHNADAFNSNVINQLIQNYVLVYIIELNNGMSKLVHGRPGDSYGIYAKKFTSHKAMMEHLIHNYVQKDFRNDLLRFTDYDWIKYQFSSGKERIVSVFRDSRNVAFELNVIKYEGYTEEEPLVIFGIKEIV